MRYDTVLFDMDGTLLDTLEDLYESVNELMDQLGYPKRTREEVRASLGHGARHVMESALPAGSSDEEIDRCLDLYRPIYKKNMANHTRPYDGILDMLRALKQNGFKIAVVTNKPDYACAALCDQMFGGMVDASIGDREDIPRKPAPDSAFMMLERLDSKPETTLYMGDSATDIHTAKNAGLTSVGVSWGFRDEQSLRNAGADHIIHKPSELLAIAGIA